MSLPKIVTPEYYVQLKSIKEPVKYRPYLVKEEKIFLTAKESDDPKDINNAVRQILRNCTFDAIDVDSLPSFDIEYLFLQLRAKSVNNIVNMSFRCENKIPNPTPSDDAAADAEPPRCHQVNTVVIDIDTVTVTTPENHTSTIQINDDLTIEFTYPTMASLGNVLQKKDQVVLAGPVIAASIKTVVNKEGVVYEARDHSQEEWIEFVESMPVKCLENCAQFFQTMPKLRYETEFKCTKCGYAEPLVLEGIGDFFE